VIATARQRYVRLPKKARFARDSPLEEDGFEPPVPLGGEVLERSNTSTGWVLLQGGTEGSNPSSSSGESQENRIFGRCRSGVT